MLDFVEIKLELEDKLKNKVDLISYKIVHLYIKEYFR